MYDVEHDSGYGYRQAIDIKRNNIAYGSEACYGQGATLSNGHTHNRLEDMFAHDYCDDTYDISPGESFADSGYSSRHYSNGDGNHLGQADSRTRFATVQHDAHGSHPGVNASQYATCMDTMIWPHASTDRVWHDNNARKQSASRRTGPTS
ncbi:hypothetical protein MRB53_037128 [Persea americana]|nr:hypothetical protein MRB53_037128 [Persea americana]